MKLPALILLTTAALAQIPRQTQSITNEDLRGVSAVSPTVAWASGTHGTYLRTTDGHTWLSAQVPDAATLDFRGVVAFSADEAFLMSSGPGDQSRIYHTHDAGQTWQLQLTAANPKSFFDSIAFWDSKHGIVLGDPIPDEQGHLKFQLLITEDGQTWTALPTTQLPDAQQAEGAFAASNSCLAILHTSALPTPPTASLTQPSQTTTSVPLEEPWKSGASAPRQPTKKEGASAPADHIWFATGGRAARVFHSPDRGQTWQVFPTPLAHGPDSAGIFSIAFRDPQHGAIAGGDYKHPDDDGPNLAFTNDGGQTWQLSKIFPQSYYSSITYDTQSLNQPLSFRTKPDDQAHSRLFLANPKFLLDFRPPRNPTRISPPKKSPIHFNALSPYPQGGALAVGPKGTVATLP